MTVLRKTSGLLLLLICTIFVANLCPMKKAFFKLHLSILLAGFTGLFGKIISLNEGLLVWYRMLFASLLLFLFLAWKGELRRMPVAETLRIAAPGLLLAFHWVFFYGSIKASNVSIGVICFSLVGFFTAALAPLVDQKRFSFQELAFSLLTVGGVLLIFQLDIRYRTGILLGIVSSALCALFTLVNKRIGGNRPSSLLLAYEMLGGFLGLSLVLPLYLSYFPSPRFWPGAADLGYLVVLSSLCTIGVYLLQIQVLKTISAFTVSLSYNLEPVYSILLAMLFLGEARQLNYAFYIGLTLICLSVGLQTRAAIRAT